MVTISVIIPAYNVDAYINNCLKSVISQRDASFEVILVNDGSTDETSVSCKKWADKYENIHYYEQENKGQGSARNLGISHAVGEWLVFLDADDEMLPGGLRWLEQSVSDDIDILWYESRVVLRNQSIYNRKIPRNINEKNELMQAITPELWDKMFRTSLWRRENIQLSDLYGEDNYAVYMLCAKARKIQTLLALIVCHYERPSSLTLNPSRVAEIVKSHTEVLEKFYEKGMLEDFRWPLFLMVEKEYFNHCRIWKNTLQKESKMIAGQLGELSGKYFSDEHSKLIKMKEGTIVLIGNLDRLPFGFQWFWDVCYFANIEHFLLSEYRSLKQDCHFVIDIENETCDVRMQVRTLEWALSYWKIQCGELEEFRRENRLRGGVFLYDHHQGKNQLVESFKTVATEYWDYDQPESLEKLWKALCEWNYLEEELSIQSRKHTFDNFNYRWECLRLNKNTNILATWIRIKQSDCSLASYLIWRGYNSIGIYGAGYIGELLINELKDSAVSIKFLIDRSNKAETKYRIYRPEDELPLVDVVIVTVVHEYERICSEISCACPVISLQEVIEWCSKRLEH